MAALIDVIDDDDAVRDSTRALLESFGYVVRDHATAEMFLAHSDPRAECIIVDQHMPGMNGLELIEYIRRNGDKTPALMITGRSDATIEPRAAQIGLRVLHKPIPEEQLVEWIESVLHAPA